jgi:uncharacterized protein (TIGR02996 family)
LTATGQAECRACGTVWRPLEGASTTTASPTADPELTALFERVAQVPDDDAPRLVMADLLLERGDPRGEFLSLQLAQAAGDSSARTKGRLKILEGRHARGWLPPGVDAATAEFRRGFLVSATLVGSTNPLHREWGAIEELHLTRGATGPAPFEVRRLNALRHLAGCLRPQLEALVRHRPDRLALLAMDEGDEVFVPGYEALVAQTLERLPTVRCYAVQTGEYPYDDGVNPVVETLVRSLGPRLDVLRVPARDTRVLLLQRALREVAPALRVQLMLGDDEAGQAWLEFDALRIGLTVKGEPSSAIIDVAKRVMHHAGYGHVEVYAIDRDDAFIIST